MALVEQRLQFNGEMEVGRHSLRSRGKNWACEQDWEACLNREKTEYRQRGNWRSTEAQFVQREQALAEDKTWERVKAKRPRRRR